MSASLSSIDLNQINHFFFIGIAGYGMSALAQYIKKIGKDVSGSDRNFQYNRSLDIKQKLEQEGIKCYTQDGSGITDKIQLVVVSTIVSQKVEEIVKSKNLGLTIITRSDLLSLIVRQKKTISVGGTSGKSTTTAMIFHILQKCGLSPSVISGASLVEEIKKGKIGNCVVGKGEWLVIEADESDGSIIKYNSQIGVLLNISRDHKQINQLTNIFEQFQKNSKMFVKNKNVYEHSQAQTVFKIINKSAQIKQFKATSFKQQKFQSWFQVNQTKFNLKLRGYHNCENALAAISVCSIIVPSLESISNALGSYSGVSRRCEFIGKKNGVTVIDDYAHNTAKCRAIIRSLKQLSQKLIIWFQPQGFAIVQFLMEDFAEMFIQQLRQNDEIWINQIYFAQGSDAVASVSCDQLVEKIIDGGRRSFYIENRSQFPQKIKQSLENDTIILTMGARDPSLSQFSHFVFSSL